MKELSLDKAKAIKITLAVFIGMSVLFGAYSAMAYSTDPTTTQVTYKTLYMEKGELSHAGFFSNETIYKNGTSLKYYPEKITGLIVGNYDYSIAPETEGNYRAVLRTDYYVVSNKERIYLMNTTQEAWSGKFSGSFSIPVTFNISKINGELKVLREGTGLFRASVDTYLLVEVQMAGKEPFTHRITLAKDTSGMLKLTEPEKDYKKVERYTNTTANSINFAGKEVLVSTGRTVFPALALLFMMPPLGFAYTHREKKPKDELKGLRKFMVEGVPSEVEAMDPVELSSAEDLERVFDLVDKPIVHYTKDGHDVYAVVDGELVYEYRKPLPREGKKAN
ncbi:DUF5305 family protein [Thermococcus pacificus]|uniref:DUF5305 domain-containing protein n=1 Tax=Thermococcus pacificus TaxID=71998 RepID=A0A218P6Q7_9EURY|nr:DUF5305 family protein [Thermococcus pacificus]ASJ06441.1 hypothetical protein A3L08_03390 [Thermococcus pacificus]